MVKKRSLAGIAGIVAFGTLISKVVGLFRELAIAAAFGTGAVSDAYSYAYNLPGFLLILLGGINGPFHSALVSALKKREKEEAAPIVETVTTIVTIALLAVTFILIFFADTFISIFAHGLNEDTKALAIQQLQIMAPTALLAGLIGIGFGTLNAADMYWLPSISPLFSSLALIGGLIVLAWQLGAQISSPEHAYFGSIVLAGGTMAGAILQWVVQLTAQSKAGMGGLRFRFDWRNQGVKDTLKVMIPATLSSGTLQINVATDLFFASTIQGAGAAMRYANFVVQTPLGIISNVILVPLLPVFSQLAAPENWGELKLRIRQGLLLTALTMLPLSTIFISLSVPIVRIIYERYAFKSTSTQLVASLLVAYGVGMFFYLARDVLVRVFYALGDGELPFRVSIGNIILNVTFDIILVKLFGAPGIIFSTVSVNVISTIVFLAVLHRRLNGLPLREWVVALAGLVFASVLAGLGSWGMGILFANYIGASNFILVAIQLGVSSLVALTIFVLIVMQLKLPELNILITRLRQKLRK
jgi:putative peptidoglycan lipid II flippase